MKTTIDMSNYEIEPDEMEIEYIEEEAMSYDWNPPVELTCGLQEVETSDETSGIASDIFLRKMYSYQH